jgi:integrase
MDKLLPSLKKKLRVKHHAVLSFDEIGRIHGGTALPRGHGGRGRWNSGLRIGEQIALRPIDLDFQGHLIRVRRNYYRNRITSPKGNRGRNVDMEPELEETLAGL